MLFSRQKRLQRDRDAGLVFCWRGGQGGNRGGMFFSVVIASLLFTIAFWGLSLSFDKSKPEPRKVAKILLLDKMTTGMALWIDQNSPFPSRWDPKDDVAHSMRVKSSLEGVYQAITEPPSPWREMPDVVTELDAPNLVQRGVVELGSLPKPLVSAHQPSVLELVVSLDAIGDLAKRTPDTVSAINVTIPKQEYGSGLRFIVTLNSKGRVVFCAPVEWQASDYAMNIENWVRSQKFKSSKSKDLEVGEVFVRVEVKNHAGN